MGFLPGHEARIGGEPSGLPSALAYNGLHLDLSLVVGTVAATMVALSERLTGFWFFSFMVLVGVGVYAIGALGAVAVEFKGISDWPTVILGTAAWLLGMTVYLWAAHPRLASQIGMDTRARGG